MLRSTKQGPTADPVHLGGRNPDTAFVPATKDPDQAFTVEIKEYIKFIDEKPKLSASERDCAANMCFRELGSPPTPPSLPKATR